MHSLTAKPLGFPAAIAHGMWTKARCLAALESRLPDAFERRRPFPQADPASRHASSSPAPRRARRSLFAVRDAKRQTPTSTAAAAARAKPKPKPGGKTSDDDGADKNPGVAERSMGFGLRALNRLAGSDLLDRIRLRKQVERALFQGTKDGFRTATAAGRTFKAAQQLGKPARQKKASRRASSTSRPDDEQEMFQEAVATSPRRRSARPR